MIITATLTQDPMQNRSSKPLPELDSLELARIRGDFPALKREIHGHPLVYLDNAATTLKPQPVLDALMNHYAHDSANVHRGVHLMSQLATDAFEGAREIVRAFIHAPEAAECVFVRGATEGINLVAQSWGRANVTQGDEILITGLEHHSNIVPWQMLCAQTGATLKVAPLDDAGDVDMEAFAALLNPRTKLVAAAHVSNALGTINPVKEMVELAHDVGAMVLIDGAQALPHLTVDVQAIGCDFYVFSGHKIYAPTGIGVLWGRRAVLEAMPPWQGGGDMILSVTFEETTYNTLPSRLEAGTPHIAGAIGLGAALNYVSALGLEAIAAHEAKLLAYGTKALKRIPELRIIGEAKHKAGVLSFVVDQCTWPVHPHDIGSGLDALGIAIRAGHHCAQPVAARYGVPATARASLGIYNNLGDIDRLVEGIEHVLHVWKVRA